MTQDVLIILGTIATAAVLIALSIGFALYQKNRAQIIKTDEARAAEALVWRLVVAAEQMFLESPDRREWVIGKAKEYLPYINTDLIEVWVEYYVGHLNGRDEPKPVEGA